LAIGTNPALWSDRLTTSTSIPRRAPWIATSSLNPASTHALLVAVQHLNAPRENEPKRVYLLAGLLRCAVCERLMESCWTHGRPAYRCRHGHTSTTRPNPNRPPNAYVREDQVPLHLPALVIRLCADTDGHLPPPAAAGTVAPAGAVAQVRARQVS
jgi:site-specific DNA recombinase